MGHKLSSFSPKIQEQIRKQLWNSGTKVLKNITEFQVKPLLNQTEQRYCDRLEASGYAVLKQAVTLRMDPPYQSYRPDLAYIDSRGALVFVEVKGPHRFRERGIAKAALAAKTYPMFRFDLADWTGHDFKVSVLTP